MQIGCRLRTPYIDVGGYNLREEVLRWLNFYVNNPMDKYHFLTPKEGRTYIYSKNTSLGKIMEMISDSRQNNEDISRPSEAKLIDYSYAFAISKVKEILSCYICDRVKDSYEE